MVDVRVRRGASWFYWIAGLSLFKVLVASSGLFAIPVVSLATVVLMQNVAVVTGSWVLTALSVVILIAFGALGYFAGTGQRWAFIVGMAVYALDGLLFFGVFNVFAVFGLAFHGYVLWRIYAGFSVLVSSQTNEQILRNFEIQRQLQQDKETRDFAAGAQPQPWIPPKIYGRPTDAGSTATPAVPAPPPAPDQAQP